MTTNKPSCDEHEHADGCLCEAPISADEATHDRDLPEARGGVEGDLKRRRKPKGDRVAVKESA